MPLEIMDLPEDKPFDVDAFARNAEKISGLSQRAPRNYKSVTLPMNEHEFTRLRQAIAAEDRGVLDFMRRCLKTGIASALGED